MKRPMLGGTHRGPVGVRRQRRTVRFVQILLVLVSGGLMMFAGYSFGRVAGYEMAQRGDPLAGPRPPSLAQPVVLVILGGLSITAAAALQAGSGVKLPTPARLDDLAGRAEREAIERAERSANPDQASS